MKHFALQRLLVPASERLCQLQNVSVSCWGLRETKKVGIFLESCGIGSRSCKNFTSSRGRSRPVSSVSDGCEEPGREAHCRLIDRLLGSEIESARPSPCSSLSLCSSVLRLKLSSLGLQNP